MMHSFGYFALSEHDTVLAGFVTSIDANIYVERCNQIWKDRARMVTSDQWLAIKVAQDAAIEHAAKEKA